MRYVHKDSEEYKYFIEKLEHYKDSVCSLCWGFLKSSEKLKHNEHAIYIVTPSFFRYEDLFLKLAKKHNKIRENDTVVAIFNDTCK